MTSKFDFSIAVRTEDKGDGNGITFRLNSIYDLYKTMSISSDTKNYEKPDDWEPISLNPSPNIKTFEIEKASPDSAIYQIETGEKKLTIREGQDIFNQYEELLIRNNLPIIKPEVLKINGFTAKVSLETNSDRIIEMTYNLKFVDMKTIITELFDYSQEVWKINMSYHRNPKKKGSSTIGYMWQPWWTISIRTQDTFFVPIEQVRKMVRYIAKNARSTNKAIAKKVLDRKILEQLEDRIN